jgi:hypothetical protein
MITFLEFMKQHTILSHYRVEDPRLAHQISQMNGTEVDFDEDEQGATVVIDSMSHPKTHMELNRLADERKIRRVAGAATRDMTGKARAMGTEYLNTQG